MGRHREPWSWIVLLLYAAVLFGGLLYLISLGFTLPR